MGPRIAGLYLCLAVLCLGWALPAPASAWEWVVGPPRTEIRPWSTALVKGEKPPGKRTLRVWVGLGHCVGEKEPYIHRVQVNESRRRAVIRVYVRWPEPLEVSGEVQPGEPVPACADIGLYLQRRVKLGQAVEDVRLFDGYFSPPQRR